MEVVMPNGGNQRGEAEFKGGEGFTCDRSP